MKLHGRNRLQILYGLDSQTDKWLCAWISEITNGNWKEAKDVLRRFPHANSVTDNIFQFRVGVKEVWIEVAMSYPTAVAIVTDLKRFN
jgi:mRNA-degrading endonuclease HigB of HigAB toxin-antitoxin module